MAAGGAVNHETIKAAVSTAFQLWHQSKKTGPGSRDEASGPRAYSFARQAVSTT